METIIRGITNVKTLDKYYESDIQPNAGVHFDVYESDGEFYVAPNASIKKLSRRDLAQECNGGESAHLKDMLGIMDDIPERRKEIILSLHNFTLNKDNITTFKLYDGLIRLLAKYPNKFSVYSKDAKIVDYIEELEGVTAYTDRDMHECPPINFGSPIFSYSQFEKASTGRQRDFFVVKENWCNYDIIYDLFEELGYDYWTYSTDVNDKYRRQALKIYAWLNGNDPVKEEKLEKEISFFDGTIIKKLDLKPKIKR